MSVIARKECNAGTLKAQKEATRRLSATTDHAPVRVRAHNLLGVNP